ncbi:MAG: c-type cytochrome [Acidiferrobacterales bacterium]
MSNPVSSRQWLKGIMPAVSAAAAFPLLRRTARATPTIYKVSPPERVPCLRASQWRIPRIGLYRTPLRKRRVAPWVPLFVALLFIAAGFTPAAAQMMSGPYGRPGAGSGSAPPGNADQGRQIAAAKCALCHGPDGNSTDPLFPKLSGQNPAYLYNQLLAFKNKTRPSAIMAPMAADLSEPDAADVASFYSTQRIRPDSVKDRTLAKEGEQIFGGRASRPGVPACAMCHGPGGARRPAMMSMMGGMMAPIPNLYGQHAPYLVEQLNNFATGRRQGAMMNGAMMNRIAAALSESDRTAVAAYLSGLR